MDQRIAYVYCVCDSLSRQVRYVGKTLNLPHAHIRGYRVIARRNHPLYTFNTELMKWFRALDALKVEPMIVTLEIVHNEYARSRESMWIHYFHMVGEPLLNKAYY